LVGWGLLMGLIYLLWRRTSLLAIGGTSHEAQEVCSLLTFPIQLFDDLFTGIIFLNVVPFSALFFGMIIFYFIRDLVRDAGYGWVLLDWIRGKREQDLNLRCRDILLRYHLSEQNLFSELLAAIVVPTAVALDLLYTEWGFGVNTITKGLTGSEQIELLQMFAVLLSVEVVTHAIVRRLLKRQLAAFRHHAQEQARTGTRTNTFTSPRRSMSMIITSAEWNANSHNTKYWNGNFAYFMSMVAFALGNVLFRTAELRQRLFV